MNEKYYIDARASALDSKFEARLANFEMRIEQKLSLALRWVIATTLGGVILNTSILVSFLNRPSPIMPTPAPVMAPAPIIIYAQPAPLPFSPGK